MPNNYSTTRSFPFLPSMSTKARQLADRAFSEQEDRRRKASAARARRIEQLSEQVQRQLRGAVGAREYARLRDAIRAERLAFRHRFEPPEGLRRDHTKEKNAGRKRVDALLKKAVPDRARLTEIVRAAGAKSEAVISPDTGPAVSGFNLRKHFAKWTELSPLHQFPLPWGPPVPIDDPNDPHRWFVFTPPFFGFLFSQDFVATENFRVDRLLFLDPPSGLVGNEATMDCEDAGDFDIAHVIGDSQIAVSFTPPAAGLIEVLIDAQSASFLHHIEITDEWGFSNAFVEQSNHLMMNVLHPNVPQPSTALMSTVRRSSDGEDLFADEERLGSGAHYFAQLISSGPVPANQPVIVTAGTRTIDVSHANDMEVHSRSNFKSLINSLE